MITIIKHDGAFLKKIPLILHSSACCFYWFTVFYELFYLHIPSYVYHLGVQFAGQFKFLTHLNLLIQWGYFTFSLLIDLAAINHKTTLKNLVLARKLRDYFMSSLAFPVAFFVGFTFWLLYSIDREFVFPKVLDTIIPNWYNHAVHTWVMIFIVLELVASPHQYPRKRCGLTGLLTFLTGYIAWIHFLKIYTGAWPYPILDVLPLILRIIFIALCVIIACGFYLFGESANIYTWDKESVLKKKSEK